MSRPLPPDAWDDATIQDLFCEVAMGVAAGTIPADTVADTCALQMGRELTDGERAWLADDVETARAMMLAPALDD